MKSKCHVVFPHRPTGIGGPNSFQRRLQKGLEKSGYSFSFFDDGLHANFVFIVGGTRKLFWVWRKSREGAKIIFRLDGYHWEHRVNFAGPKNYIMSIAKNLIMWILYKFLADKVIFQSEFVKVRWFKRYGTPGCAWRVIHNGVEDLWFQSIQPRNDIEQKIVCVEGTVRGLPAVAILQAIDGRPVHLYGNIDPSIRDELEAMNHVTIHGPVDQNTIREVYREKVVFLNLETNPPCPNAVIEAMASGVPVVGFDSGSLSELLGPNSGTVLPYNSNPWLLQPPDTTKLNEKFEEVFRDYADFSEYFQSRARRKFTADEMVSKYQSELRNHS